VQDLVHVQIRYLIFAKRLISLVVISSVCSPRLLIEFKTLQACFIPLLAV